VDRGPESPNAPLIVIRNVSRRYVRGVDDIHALENVSLAIVPGRFVAFMGPSGSGIHRDVTGSG
jgi:ABC-type multidrug transport system ATPase subunit